MRHSGLVAFIVLLTLIPRLSVGEESKPPSLSPGQMEAIMHNYERGERLASIPFGLAAATTLVTGGLLLANGGTLERGAGWPLLSVGAIEAAAALVLATRMGGYEQRMTQLLHRHPADFADMERKHVAAIVRRNQPILFAIEAAMVVTGTVLGAVGGSSHSNYMEGVGIGVGAQGLAMFVLDWAVLDRALAYQTALDEFRP